MFAEAGLPEVLEALRGGEPLVVHGTTSRLPDWLQNPALKSAADFCAAYRGRILYGRRDRGAGFQTLKEGAAADLFNDGEALYLPDLDEVVPQVSPWLREFERQLGIPSGSARATAWLAPPGEGTALHFDAEDVISIQLLGCKTFQVSEPAALRYAAGYQFGPGIPPAADLYPQAAAGFPDPAQAKFTEVLMEPGSVLVLPRGHWHHTRARDASLSVSIILAPPLLMDWALGVLRHWSLEDPRWRVPLYGAVTVEQHQAMRTALQEWAAAFSEAPVDGCWGDGTTLQWNPSRSLEDGDPPLLLNHYNSSRMTLPSGSLPRAVLNALAKRKAAFTLKEAREEWGEAIDSALAALVAVDALYCWPVPRRLKQRD